MTDRDTFAAAALSGILSQCAAQDRDPAETASLAYRHADAMLREQGTADNEISRLRSKLRLQDAVIRSGAVLLLTDEEREAVEWCRDNITAMAHPSSAFAYGHADTLRKLLERLK